MMKKSVFIMFLLFALLSPQFKEVIPRESPEILEEGPVLHSRIITQSSLATFNMKKVILAGYRYVSDKIEYPLSEGSVAFGTFSAVTWSDLRWATRDYQSPIDYGFILFTNNVFQIRYTPLLDDYYFRINNTYPIILQNFTVPPSYDGFEVKYVWLIVRVYSGSVSLRAEIWNYGMISFGTSTESVTITGPYDWWIALKMTSPRILNASEVYRLEVIWETGTHADLKLISDVKDADDNAQGNARFFNTTSGSFENILGEMLEGVFTYPVSNTYSTSFSPWPGALYLRSYRIYLHGRNIPKSNIAIKVNSITFGTGEAPALFPHFPFDEYVFWIQIHGSISFAGGALEISSNLGLIEQSRTSYDEDHLPPFFRPFASLSVFTDNAGKPWGEWELESGAWKAFVEDYYGNTHTLPAEKVEQREVGLKVTYPLFFYPPASPSYGFLNFTAKFNYIIEVFSRGPEFYSNYYVSPMNNASWKVYNQFFSFKAPSYSLVTIKIGLVPRDWVIQRASITPGAGGGIPSVSIVNNEITISNIVMGDSDTYFGRAEIYLKADNYLETQAAYVRFRWMDVYSSVFLENDTIRIEARAASATSDFPPGMIWIRVVGPETFSFTQYLNQLDQNGVITGGIRLSRAGQYSVSVTYVSSDGLRVGATETSFNTLRIFASTDKKIVLLSSPTLIIELNSSDVSPISLARFALTAPNGSARMIVFDQVGSRFIREISFSQTDPSAIGNWVISTTVLFKDGVSRQLPVVNFTLVDDIPPAISNMTRSPREATFMEDVNITCIVTDRGTGVKTVWVSYSSGGLTQNVTAKPVGSHKYSAIIPRQPPLTTVSYRVYAVDKSGNLSSSETITYGVGIPLWLSITITILILVPILLIVWRALYVKRLKKPPSSSLVQST
ncbi:MAG: hypothetical protein QXR97_02360 [Thermoproteota archaeon]